MLSNETVKELLISLPDVAEEITFTKTSYRAYKKIFATYDRVDNLLVLLLSSANQGFFHKKYPDTVSLAKGKYGEEGWTIFDTSTASLDLIKKAVDLSYDRIKTFIKKKTIENIEAKKGKDANYHALKRKNNPNQLAYDSDRVTKLSARAKLENKLPIHIISSEFILYVRDINVSTRFYEQLLRKKPKNLLVGKTYFLLTYIIKLGLVANDSMENIFTNTMPSPSTGVGIPRCELYLYVKDVAAEFQHAVEIGAKIISPVSLMDWGHLVCYIADPDGHVIALAQEIVVND